MLNDFGAFEVQRQEFPDIDTHTQFVVYASHPVLVGNAWVLQGTVNSKALEEIEAYLTKAKNTKKNENRALCRDAILAKHPITEQLNASLGIYSQTVVEEIKDFIVRCIFEEDRVAALIDKADLPTDIDQIEEPTYPTE